MEAFESHWDDFQEQLEKYKETADDLRAYFNYLIDGEDDLGDILFGDYDDFRNRVAILDAEHK